MDVPEALPVFIAGGDGDCAEVGCVRQDQPGQPALIAQKINRCRALTVHRCNRLVGMLNLFAHQHDRHRRRALAIPRFMGDGLAAGLGIAIAAGARPVRCRGNASVPRFLRVPLQHVRSWPVTARRIFDVSLSLPVSHVAGVVRACAAFAIATR